MLEKNSKIRGCVLQPFPIFFIQIDKEYSCVRSYGCVEDPRTKDAIMNDEPITLKINGNLVQALAGPMEVELSLSFVNNGSSAIGATSVGCQTLNGSSCEITLPTITRDGYTILGWSKLAAATSATYAAGSTADIYERGTYYAITEDHKHAHVHELETHEHKHNHSDGHHDHSHDTLVEGEHSHVHTHEKVAHTHKHLPDLHHRHMHES